MRWYTLEMEVLPLGSGVWAFPGGVNLGAISAEGEVVLIDAGLDDGPARKVWRWAEEEGLRPRAAVLTHAHADHFGGAYLWASRGLPLYASELEGMMMEHPFCEPFFLFSGAAPLSKLLEKFTMAKPCPIAGALTPGPKEFGPVAVEVVDLPGHAPAQIGVKAGPILFCADALFPEDILRKHPIPFCHDLSQALASLKAVEEAEVVIPGHGPILKGADVTKACAAFREHLERIREITFEGITTPKSAEEILAEIANILGASFTTVTEFLLARTTILATLSSLVRESSAEAVVEGNQLLWRRR